MKKLFSLLLISFLISATIFAQDENYLRLRIHADKQQLKELLQAGVAIDHGVFDKNALLCELSQKDLVTIKDLGIDFEILISDMAEFYRERNIGVSMQINRMEPSDYPVPQGWEYGSMGGMYTLDEVMAELDTMRQEYPDLISSVQQIGNHTSNEGHPMNWIRISDNPDQNEDEPEVLYTALHHAREGIGVQQMIYFMYHLLENYETDPHIQSIVNNTELYFVPVINPDGYIFNEMNEPNGGGMWRKNRRDNGNNVFGVDLNRNYGYMWGYDNNGSSPYPDDDTYRGTEAFSEPETQAIREFCNGHDFRIALNYHSYSNLLLYAWGYTDEPCPDDELYHTHASLMTQENNYTFGAGSSTIYPTNGGSDDWMYGEQTEKPMILSYTPEVGGANDGFWPSISRIIPLCQENMLQNILAARLAGNYAEVKDISAFAIGDISGSLAFEIQRLGLEDDGTFSVSIEAVNDAIVETGDPVDFTGMDLLETAEAEIGYTLRPDLIAGDEIVYLLKLDNGSFVDADTINKIFGQPYTIFEDDCNDFENWNGAWFTTSEHYHSASASITDSPGGEYGNNQINITTLEGEIDLGGSIYAMLSFWARWEVEADYDYVQLLISTDGGNSWDPLQGKYTNPGSNYQAFGEPVYDGFQQEWVKEEIPLNDYLGESIKLRFLLDSDGYLREDGFYFDDVNVSILSDVTGIENREDRGLISGPIPNPARESATFLLEQNADGVMKVFNAAGKLMFEENISGKRSNFSIKLSAWEKGFYYYRFHTKSGSTAQGKLIVW